MNKITSEIRRELADAERMYNKIAFDPRRKIDQPCEKLHYWDGKVTGLKIAMEAIERHNRITQR